MEPRRKIEIKKKELQRGYLEDTQSSVTRDKEIPVRKSFLISQALETSIQAYIYQRRTQGDIYYSQTDLVRDALTAFLTKHIKNA